MVPYRAREEGIASSISHDSNARLTAENVLRQMPPWQVQMDSSVPRHSLQHFSLGFPVMAEESEWP